MSTALGGFTGVDLAGEDPCAPGLRGGPLMVAVPTCAGEVNTSLPRVNQQLSSSSSSAPERTPMCGGGGGLNWCNARRTRHQHAKRQAPAVRRMDYRRLHSLSARVYRRRAATGVGWLGSGHLRSTAGLWRRRTFDLHHYQQRGCQITNKPRAGRRSQAPASNNAIASRQNCGHTTF